MDWIENFYGDRYLDTHLPLLTDDVNKADVDFMLDVLKLDQGSEILDVPCGFGRHSILFAEKDFNVTGIDFKPEFIDLAKKNSTEKGLDINFLVGDMRSLEFENKFDAVINFFTSTL